MSVQEMRADGPRRRRVIPRFAALPLWAALTALGACTVTEPPAVAVTAALAVAPSRSPEEPKDDKMLGKEHYRAQNYGLAELHFRRAVERHKDDPEAWLGLAAAYDQLKRFRLADRAYAQAIKRAGPTAEILNNRGYSYMLRGDLRRASADLSLAAAKDPESEHIRNNLSVLDQRARGRF
jgi:Flp pilus assembly protein TadD